jgi:hypothetical protein
MGCRMSRRWLVPGLVLAIALLGAAMVGQVAREWMASTRAENADMACSARGGVLNPDSLTCLRTAADGSTTVVGYSSTPSTLEEVAAVAVAVILTLAIELALLVLLWQTWRWTRQRSAAKAGTPSNGVPNAKREP